MIIVLDTNVIRAHPILDSPAFRELAVFVKGNDHRLVVPEVVLRELDGHIAAEFRKIEAAFNHFNRETKYTAGITPPGEPEQRRLAATLRQRLLDLGAEFEPIPAVPHEIVMDRIYEQKAPFRKSEENKESGYKDFLLWGTVLELARGSFGQEVVLITADGDFRQGSELHPDLAADAHGLDISVVRNVKVFTEKVIPPPSATDMTLREQVGASLGELTAIISGEFEDMASRLSIDSRESHLPYRSDKFRLTRIDELAYADILTVRRLDDDEVLVAAALHGVFVVSDEYSPEDPWQIDVLDDATPDYFAAPFNKRYGVVEFKVAGMVNLDILLPIEDGEITQPTALELTEFSITDPPSPFAPPADLPLFPFL